MFIFEKLDVYHLSTELYVDIRKIQFEKSEEGRVIAKQLLRCSLSVSLNISEGSGKNTSKDRRNFFFIARGSLYETIAVVIILRKAKILSETEFENIYVKGERISKMLCRLIELNK